jgi:hypothetical protein
MKEKLQALVVCMSLTALVVSVGTPYFHGGKPTVADEQRELEESPCVRLCSIGLTSNKHHVRLQLHYVKPLGAPKTAQIVTESEKLQRKLGWLQSRPAGD